MNRQKLMLYLAYVVALLTLLSLFLLSQATEGSEKFERFYLPLLISIIFGIFFLIIIVCIYLFRLFLHYRQRQAGASLSLTILWRTLLLAFIPLLLTSFFAFKFLRYEFQSSFDEGINEALNNALVLSKKALDIRIVQALKTSNDIANQVMTYDYRELQTKLESVRQQFDVQELTVLDEQGFIQAFSSEDLSTVIPLIPSHNDFERAKTSKGIFVLQSDGVHFNIQTLVTVNKPGASNYYLKAIYQVPDTVSQLTEQVNRTITERDRFNYLMPQVNNSFIFVLLLVLLLAGLLLILSSISFARDMAQPIRTLIKGTRNIARGDFSHSLLVKRQDDFGTLIQSFNQMTQSLKNATEVAETSREQVESERAYLAAVINHMTAGVVTLDYKYRLQTYNDRAKVLLDVDLSMAILKSSEVLTPALDNYQQLIKQALSNYDKGQQHEIEVEIVIANQPKTLITHITALPSTDALHGGYVIIFENLSHYLQKQKQAAWEEVARRLAHEIKNPLTPIQLATERLNYKLSGHLQTPQQQILSRSVDVITKQVESLKNMVNDFSDFAKPTNVEKKVLSLSPLLKDVFDLYQGHYAGIEFSFDNGATRDCINGNAQLLRQVLHNVIKNAIEACEMRGNKDANYTGNISLLLENQDNRVMLTITDNGIGLPEEGDGVFEPYVTTKEKGTGLGLAIVKKLLQAHQGSIVLTHRQQQQGAVAKIILPLDNETH